MKLLIFIREYPESKDQIEDRLDDIIYLLFDKACSSENTEYFLQLIAQLINFEFDFGIYIEQLIIGILSLYHEENLVSLTVILIRLLMINLF